MPDFTVRPIEGIFDSDGNAALAAVPWLDPTAAAGSPVAGLARPTRVFPDGIPHLHWLLRQAAQVTVKCKPDGGSEGADDASLAGRFFGATFIEAPGYPPTITQDPGFTSIIHFTPISKGHYTLGILRIGGGAVILHFDLE